MAYFVPVSKYTDAGLPLPERKTQYSAGYDLVAAKDTIIPSYAMQYEILRHRAYNNNLFTLKETADLTKTYDLRPTLVSTGMKCCGLQPNEYLELSMRSSTPLKYWLVLANGIGIIDSDYADNPDNEGEIFLQIINFAPFDILIKKGEAIGQGIIKNYLTVENDNAVGVRKGGFGSTGKKNNGC